MKIEALILGVALSLTATPAVAADTEAPRHAVRYADLDLTTESGQIALSRRIDRAAREVCGIDEKRTGSLLPASSAVECFKTARATAHTRMAELIANQRPAG